MRTLHGTGKSNRHVDPLYQPHLAWRHRGRERWRCLRWCVLGHVWALYVFSRGLSALPIREDVNADHDDVGFAARASAGACCSGGGTEARVASARRECADDYATSRANARRLLHAPARPVETPPVAPPKVVEETPVAAPVASNE